MVSGSQCLLARQRIFPKGYFAPIAGFLEAGETPEQAVSREVFEEVGLKVERVSYVAAQPWPFPSSLMLGYIAHVLPDQQIRLSTELEQAIWVDQVELREVFTGLVPKQQLLLPPIGVIGRALIHDWLANDTALKPSDANQ